MDEFKTTIFNSFNVNGNILVHTLGDFFPNGRKMVCIHLSKFYLNYFDKAKEFKIYVVLYQL